jgi:hypothetical protein
MQPVASKRHRSRRRREELVIVAITVVVMGLLGFFWLMSLYGGHI